MNKKGFIHIAIIVGIVVITIAGYFVLRRRTMPLLTPNYRPTPPTSTTPQIPPKIESDTGAITVLLGEEFILKKGETARIKDLNVFLKVKDFINSPCPKGSQCIWSGLAVVYELTVDGKVYISSFDNPLREAPYDVLIKKTDYKTYAVFIVNSR